MCIGIGFFAVIGNSVNYLLRYLGAGWPIKKDNRLIIMCTT